VNDRRGLKRERILVLLAMSFVLTAMVCIARPFSGRVETVTICGIETRTVFWREIKVLPIAQWQVSVQPGGTISIVRAKNDFAGRVLATTKTMNLGCVAMMDLEETTYRVVPTCPEVNEVSQ
jgi:hypothetical protein